MEDRRQYSHRVRLLDGYREKEREREQIEREGDRVTASEKEAKGENGTMGQKEKISRD